MTKIKNILTIDLEDWYHGLLSQQKSIRTGKIFDERIEDATETLFGLIKKRGNKGTFFVVGELAHRYPKVIQEIANDGHEIGVHSYSHKRVSEMTPEEFRYDLQKCKKAIYGAISKYPISYRAPAFSIKKKMGWAFKILAEEGFRYDSSLFPTMNPLYGDISAPRVPFSIKEVDNKIKEFPLTTLDVLGIPLPVAGGFYLRVLPLLLIMFSVERCNNNGIPFILYVHPWDIDQGQPRPVGISTRERITHYCNIGGAFQKLECLLDKYNFTSIEQFEGARA